jgi:ATP-binding cassette subfamily F protein 3
MIGTNGSGKSTLLRIAAGTEEADAGEVTRRRGLRSALLEQHPLGDARPPAATIRDARRDLAEIDAGLEACAADLADPSVYEDAKRMEAVLHRQAELLERFERAGGPAFEGRVRALLGFIGLDAADRELPTTALSGGQRKLVALAACLAQDPQLLLLDEPEAHLDLEGRALLEGLVADFEGGVLIVSHDRYLLDETVTQIAALDAGRVRAWPGNYTAYAVARELELIRQQERYASQQAEIARLEEAVRRFEHWARMVVNERHIKQARNKQRQIDRMEKIERPVLERRKIGLSLHPHQRGGQRTFELRDVTVAFGEDPVLVGVNLTVMHGERVGVVGDNGAGKSVMLKTVVGELPVSGGEVWVGPSIRIGYLAQDQQTLDPSSTPLATLRASFPGTEEQAVARLMSFLFDYEQVRRPISSMSGGEKTRLQLLLLMLSGANLLVLDEPTNHLDIDGVEALEGALNDFGGTAVFISHDRYFLDRMADRIVEVSDGEVRSFVGGYSDWAAQSQAAPLPPGSTIRA